MILLGQHFIQKTINPFSNQQFPFISILFSRLQHLSRILDTLETMIVVWSYIRRSEYVQDSNYIQITSCEQRGKHWDKWGDIITEENSLRTRLRIRRENWTIENQVHHLFFWHHFVLQAPRISGVTVRQCS